MAIEAVWNVAEDRSITTHGRIKAPRADVRCAVLEEAMPTEVVRASELEPFNFGDLAIADYMAGNGTSSSIAVINVPAGAAHPAAYSDASDKYYLVLSGAVAFHTGGEEVTLGPLDLLIIPRGTEFAYVSTEGPAQMVLVHTPPFRAEAEILTGAQIT